MSAPLNETIPPLQKGEVRCRVCGTVYIPNIIFDFYADGDDPTVGRCETCIMLDAVAESRLPTPVLQTQAEDVCKFGQSGKTCAFLVAGGGEEGIQLSCSKGSSVEHLIRTRLAEGSMSAKGDNCSGPPDFNPTAA